MNLNYEDIQYENIHQVVVHDVCKVVGGHTIRLDEDLIVHLTVVHLDMAIHHIVKAGHAFLGNLLADDIGQTSTARWLMRPCSPRLA